MIRPLLLLLALLWAASDGATRSATAAETSVGNAAMAARIEALAPELDAYIARSMTTFDVPGLAIGIVADDRLVYAKGFGIRSKSGGEPVDTRTIFQIGSTTKAFLAASIAILVDRGLLHWDDRVVDRYPEFQMADPWVTREFRVFDLLAQRSGLPILANDILTMFGFDQAALLASLRFIEPVSSFRSTFSYTNITHLLASRVAADAAGASDWNELLQADLLTPLGMDDSTYTFEALKTAPNRASGHRWTPEGTIEVPYTPIFPYHLGGAGNINSNVEDMAKWLRLQLGGGTFEGHQIVSSANLAVTHMARVALTDKLSYAMGWYQLQMRNGAILWHDGDALSSSSFVGLSTEKNVGVVILNNETDVSFPLALGSWIFDKVLGNTEIDYVAMQVGKEEAGYAASAARFERPAKPRPNPALGPLAGHFVNPSFGAVSVVVDGDGLVMDIEATGAQLRIDPWDGDVFYAHLMPTGEFGPVVDLDYMMKGFVQYQIDAVGQLDMLFLTLADGQHFAFYRQ